MCVFYLVFSILKKKWKKKNVDIFDETKRKVKQIHTHRYTQTHRPLHAARIAMSFNQTYSGTYNGQTLRHGQGELTFGNKYFSYSGDFQHGKRHGNGILTLGDGSSIEGTFVNGEITGRGLRRWPNGSTYTGDFVEGEREGQGTFIASDGISTYEGEFRGNKRWGQGELIMPAAEGTGDCQRSTVDRFVGEFVRNRPHGVGRWEYGRGTVEHYEGQFLEGKRHGERGSIRCEQGSEFVGAWDSDMQHGEGSYTDVSGFQYAGSYDKGRALNAASELIPFQKLGLIEEPAEDAEAEDDPQQLELIVEARAAVADDDNGSNDGDDDPAPSKFYLDIPKIDVTLARREASEEGMRLVEATQESTKSARADSSSLPCRGQQ